MMTIRSAGKPSGVKVLHKTLDILEAIKRQPSGLRLAEVSRFVRLPKPTVYRILATLEARGYLDRSEEASYRLGKRFLQLEDETPFEQLLNRAAQPVIDKLVASCRETVNLGVLDGGDVVVINTMESPQAVRMASKVGNRRYLHSSALGKILLSGMSDAQIVRVVRIRGMPRLTPNTIVSEKALLAEIHRVQAQGYAMDDQENESDGRCIAATVGGPNGRVVGALSISGPAHRTSRPRVLSFLAELHAACAAISKTLTQL
jgi:IclR family acetate operon transcriptional repressor